MFKVPGQEERSSGMRKSIVVLFLATLGGSVALPLANVHMKFVSPPHVYEHDIITADGRTLSQMSFTSIGRRSIRREEGQHPRYGQRVQRMRAPPNNHLDRDYVRPENAESLWPVGVFVPPADMQNLGYSWQDSTERRHVTPDFSNALEHPDPYLLTGENALLAVKYLYGRGELFYDDVPHTRALLRNQEERIMNGLHDHVLHSLRPSSPFYKKQLSFE